MRERDIERYLVKSVEELGGECRKVQWIGRRGAPDRLVMLPLGTRVGAFSSCRTIWVELKAPGKVAESHQEREHKRMARMGQVVLVIDSHDAVDALLR